MFMYITTSVTTILLDIWSPYLDILQSNICTVLRIKRSLKASNFFLQKRPPEMPFQSLMKSALLIEPSSGVRVPKYEKLRVLRVVTSEFIVTSNLS